MESLEDEMREFRKDFIQFTTICPAAIGKWSLLYLLFERLFGLEGLFLGLV